MVGLERNDAENGQKRRKEQVERSAAHVCLLQSPPGNRPLCPTCGYFRTTSCRFTDGSGEGNRQAAQMTTPSHWQPRHGGNTDRSGGILQQPRRAPQPCAHRRRASGVPFHMFGSVVVFGRHLRFTAAGRARPRRRHAGAARPAGRVRGAGQRSCPMDGYRLIVAGPR
jgi:hypothetical protein